MSSFQIKWNGTPNAYPPYGATGTMDCGVCLGGANGGNSLIGVFTPNPSQINGANVDTCCYWNLGGSKYFTIILVGTFAQGLFSGATFTDANGAQSYSTGSASYFSSSAYPGYTVWTWTATATNGFASGTTYTINYSASGLPNVVGQSAGAAAASLEAAGYLIAYSASPGGTIGQVISQSPAAGSSPAPGSTVTLYIGTGSGTESCGTLDVYDLGAGGLLIAWGPFSGVPPDGYNVYANGNLVESVTVPYAIIGGLAEASYSASAVAATPNNSSRPQNMPPHGVVTNPGTYDISVVGTVSGAEVSPSVHRAVTMQPTSIMLTTPMKRLWPFPNTGLD